VRADGPSPFLLPKPPLTKAQIVTKKFHANIAFDVRPTMMMVMMMIRVWNRGWAFQMGRLKVGISDHSLKWEVPFESRCETPIILLN